MTRPADVPITTELVVDPAAPEILTGYREVDARTALARGLVEFLRPMVINLPGGRQLGFGAGYWDWPEAEDEAVYPALTVVPEGDGEYAASSLTPVLDAKNRLQAPDGRWPFHSAELTQPLRLEVHCNDPRARQGLSMLIEDAFAPVDWMTGFKLKLPFYFGAHAHYEPLGIGLPDTPEAAQERARVVYFRFSANVSVIVLRAYPGFRPQIVTSVAP